MSINDFNPNEDKIAVVVKEFTLLEGSDSIFDDDNEPYIVSFAIDEEGVRNAEIAINTIPFPNVQKGDTVTFDGQGHLVYGPKNPGEFLTYAILFMESDGEYRDLGAQIKSIASSNAAEIIKTIALAANPTYGVALNLIQGLASVVADQMIKNNDDPLYKREGILLRDVTPSYDILRSFTGRNKKIECRTSIIPMRKSNGLGIQVDRIVVPI
jgi:hypothetical protein